MTETATKQKSIYGIYGVAIEDSEEGKWFDLDGGIRLKLRRFNSNKSMETRRRLESPFAHYAKEGKDIPDEIAKVILQDHIAQAVIVDWENMVGRDGSVLPCTPENIKTLVADPALVDFLTKVLELSIGIDNYRLQDEFDTVKN